MDVFAFDATYTEKVNTILRRFHVDTASLRRALVDHGLWRGKATVQHVEG
ncbi:MAG: DUF2087 domain-containing protein [Anaerolineales bacterium]